MSSSSSMDVLKTAQVVVEHLPTPFNKEDFMREYRLRTGNAFPSLRSLNLDVKSFNSFFKGLPNVHEALIDGEFFFLSPTDTKKRDDVLRELREQFMDLCLQVAKGFGKRGFKASNFTQHLKSKCNCQTLPLKQFDVSSVSELLRTMDSVRIRRGTGGRGALVLYEYFSGEDASEEPASATPRTPKAPRGAIPAARRVVASPPRKETLQGRRSLGDESAPVRRSVPSPSVITTIKQELPDIEIVFESAPPPAKRPNLNQELNGQQTPVQATPLHYAVPMQPVSRRPDEPKQKYMNFGYYMACRLDEAEKGGKNVGQVLSYINDAFNKG